MAPSSPCWCRSHTIKTVWPQIEAFLDLRSTIFVSQSCRRLRQEIADADTQKIEVSHFGFSEFGAWHADDAWNRIPRYVPSALNAIYFPSLRRLKLNFDPIKSRNGVDDTEDGVTSCFPLFVAHLASARNLERLYLVVDRVLDVDNARRIEPVLELFGRNLGRCKNLSDLIISSFGSGKYCVPLMRDLVVALTPTIQKQSSSIRRLGLDIGGGPEDVYGEQWLNPLRTLDFVAIDFFAAILACNGLLYLVLRLPHSFSLTNALLEAVKRVHSAGTPPSFYTLQRLHLTLDLCDHPPPTLEGEGEDYYLRSATILLNFFSECQQVMKVDLSLPQSIWRHSLEAVRKLLCGKPDLSSLYLCFGVGGLDDSDEEILHLLEDCILNEDGKGFDLGKSRSWQFEYLRRVNGRRLFNLMKNIEHAGGHFNGLEGIKSVETQVAEELAECPNPISLSHTDRVNREDFPEKIDIEHWWMGCTDLSPHAEPFQNENNCT